MNIQRVFTRDLETPYSDQKYESRVSELREKDGGVLFRQENVWVPSEWSQTATDILAQKYFRKASGSFAGENDARAVFHRLAGCWTDWGKRFGYFGKEEDAKAFYDEIAYMLAHQIASPNSPQWFNTGVFFAYGTAGDPQGHWHVDPKGGLKQSTNAYERPQAHACFIQSVTDDLVNAGGIFDLFLREARLFKFGAGTGTNFSRLRAKGEPLKSGGTSSGLLSFLRVGDAAAAAIQSGGTTRRAAKMVCVDSDHPEIEAFIDWKVGEEKKVAALVAGGKELGLDYDFDWRGEAYRSVSGQNSNNSVRLSNEFFSALEKNGEWPLRWRTTGEVAAKVRVRDLWDRIARAAHASADPGLHFETTINEWHTCPAGGPIRASNPCSEYLFLDDTGCNLASLNLRKFYDEKARAFRVESFQHACRLWTVVLEISVLMAQYPSPEIAKKSFEYRTVGLGYANLGALLMSMGIPYGEPKAQAICGALTAILTAEAYATSAEMAREQGPFARFGENREAMLRVIRNHRRAANGETDFEGLSHRPQGISKEQCPAALYSAARATWDRALALGEKHGYRNAQVSAIAPTGTIGLLMDCDTLGIEPEFALLKMKKLAGGGTLRIVNQAFASGLSALGYTEKQVAAISAFVFANGAIEGAPGIKPEHLSVFDCAQGKRALGYEAHLAILRAAQPFLSGGISKTINFPGDSAIAQIEDAFLKAWKGGLKAISIYRDGSKLSQPLLCVECG